MDIGEIFSDLAFIAKLLAVLAVLAAVVFASFSIHWILGFLILVLILGG